MPRNFFDVQDSGPQKDDVGTDCANLDAVRKAALKILPDIAKEDIPSNGERRTITVIARDEVGTRSTRQHSTSQCLSEIILLSE